VCAIWDTGTTVDEARQGGVDVHPAQIEVRHVHLQAQRLPHRVLGEVSQLDEGLAERQVKAALFGEGPGELRLVDRLGFDQDLPQLRALVGPLEEQMELPAGDQSTIDEYLPERDVARSVLLRFERLLEVGGGDETTFDQEVAEAGFGLAHEPTLGPDGGERTRTSTKGSFCGQSIPEPRVSHREARQ
jgi:hypothetical protein